jgi:cell division protease FtsH
MDSWLSKLENRTVVWRALVLALLVAISLVAVVVGAKRAPSERTVGYTELARIAAEGKARGVVVEGDRFIVERAPQEFVSVVVDDTEARHETVRAFAKAGVPLEFRSREPSGFARSAATIAPVLIIVALGAVALTIQRRRSKSHFVARTGPRTGAAVSFSDVAGMDEVKESLTETVEFLKDPQRFGRLGGRAPRGVLLTGEPGTGKTLLARAVANEAGVPFLSASGSAFQEMFVGVGASRVRSLFAEARRLAPCIVFIDEIDAVGRSRARGGDSATADHDQTLNQLLVEMDGFDHTSGIVVMASTNRDDVLDPAILRPGRFDRQVTVPLPDLRGRLEILAVHARPLVTSDVDLNRVARGTPGFSGAELANLLNEAAILAAREGADAVLASHIDRARDRILLGTERAGALIDPEERYATAVHEAGHVAVGVVAEHTDPVHKVSILPRGRSLGVTHSLPVKDRLMYRKEFLVDQICMMLGGRAAEMEVLDTMTAGAADDIERASGLARKMVAELGMGALGPVCVKDLRAPQSQALLDRVEEETRAILDEQLQRARQIVRDHRAEIDALVAELLEKDTLGAEAILACFPAAARSRPAPDGADAQAFNIS